MHRIGMMIGALAVAGTAMGGANGIGTGEARLLDTPRIDHALLDDSGRVFWALSTALTGNDMIGTATVEDGSVVLATFDIRQAASLTDVSDNGFASFAVLDIQSVSGISTVS